jgi:hypothetical protein
MKPYLLLALAPFLLFSCDGRVNTVGPGPDKVIEKNTTIVTPDAETTVNKTTVITPTTEKTTTTTTETKK